FMIMVIFFAAFQSTRAWGDMLAMFALGILATYMKRFGWPRPPLLIGYVLAGGAETYLYQAVQFYGWAWWERPIVLIIGAVIAISVFFAILFQRKEASNRGETADGGVLWPQTLFATVILLLAAYAIYDCWNLNLLGRVMPLGAALATVVLAGAVLLLLPVGGRFGSVRFD